MRPRRPSWPLAAFAALMVLGTGIRLWNAFEYPIGLGYDSAGNWQYVGLLILEGGLPHPERGWSTAHPPLFYAVAAVVTRAAELDRDLSFIGTRVVSSLAGLAAVLAAAILARRASGDDLRLPLVAGLVLFLPVHICASAMFGEEVLCAALATAAALLLVAELHVRPQPRASRVVLAGALAGLAWLTKLTGVLVAFAGVAALATAARGREGAWTGRAGRRAAVSSALFGGAALLSGGWFYLRSLWRYGYLYPHGLPAHEIMYRIPPGSRTLWDYVSVPLASFADPDLLAPEMLHSVWGTTWATIWWEAHRHFLPLSAPGLALLALAVSLLAALPSAACLIGMTRGARRWLREQSAVDALWLTWIAALLGGYVLFTWRNPWFVTAKGSYLLAGAVPFAWYASEVLSGWLRRGRLMRAAITGTLLALWGLCALVFSYGLVYAKPEPHGVEWWNRVPVEEQEVLRRQYLERRAAPERPSPRGSGPGRGATG